MIGCNLSMMSLRCRMHPFTLWNTDCWIDILKYKQSEILVNQWWAVAAHHWFDCPTPYMMLSYYGSSIIAMKQCIYYVLQTCSTKINISIPLQTPSINKNVSSYFVLSKLFTFSDLLHHSCYLMVNVANWYNPSRWIYHLAPTLRQWLVYRYAGLMNILLWDHYL